MSNSEKKKKVVGSKKKKKTVTPTVSRKKKSAQPQADTTMIYQSENFKWMLIGLAVIALGMFLMSGGAMPSPDVWDETLIYSFRRITLAPIVILIGLGIEVYAIFK